MGCDIHIITEIKKNNVWERVLDIPDALDKRNYSTFAFLADVRNSFGTKGFEAKGLPKDISRMKFDYNADDDYYGIDFSCEDYHSHSYLSLKELIDIDKTDYVSNKYKMDRKFYEDFIKLGGVLPKGMTIEQYEPSDFVDIMRFAFEPTVLIKWMPSDKETKEFPIFKGIEEMKKIAEKYSIEDFENIRIVFAFDN